VCCLQVACDWCSALSAASEGNPLVILKVIALLQTAAAHAASLQAAAAVSMPPATSSEDDAAAAQQLLPYLEPCIGLLASTMACGGGVALRSQASLALQQLLRAPGRGVCYCCLQELLGGNSSGGSSSAGDRRMHPEVAALLMQEVRLQLARTSGEQWGNASGFAVLMVAGWQVTSHVSADPGNKSAGAQELERTYHTATSATNVLLWLYMPLTSHAAVGVQQYMHASDLLACGGGLRVGSHSVLRACTVSSYMLLCRPQPLEQCWQCAAGAALAAAGQPRWMEGCRPAV
jgi:hypothetical protein